jgi:UDP-N-acetylglucosamine:LPS N-acetylglucosamine transferase
VESKEELKRQMGFHPDKKLILIIGGADGIPRGKRIVKNLLYENPGASLAVVCGKNERMRLRLLALKEERGSEHLKVFGFVDSVYELLQVSDVVITKCGASMFMETLFSRRIPIVNNYLWEQEKGNVEFLRRNHFGIYERDTRKLSSWINRLFSDARLYSSFNDNIERARLVNGAGMVSDYIVRFNAA